MESRGAHSSPALAGLSRPWDRSWSGVDGKTAGAIPAVKSAVGRASGAQNGDRSVAVLRGWSLRERTRKTAKIAVSNDKDMHSAPTEPHSSSCLPKAFSLPLLPRCPVFVSGKAGNLSLVITSGEAAQRNLWRPLGWKRGSRVLPDTASRPRLWL